MEKTVTKHEWEGNYFRKFCPHCKTWRERDLGEKPIYRKEGYYVTSVEPKCITRKIQT